MKTLTLLTTLLLVGCDKVSQPCTNSTGTHHFGKWTPTGGKSAGGTDWLKRQCEECGWQEERGAKSP